MDKNEEAIQKLGTLSQRERQVLGMVCAGLMYKDIAQALIISMPTVKSTMGRIYVKLGIDQISSTERKKIIYQVYCPLSKLSTQAPEAMPPDKELPVPSAIIRMVEEDELAVIPPSRHEVINIPIPQVGVEDRAHGRKDGLGKGGNQTGWVIVAILALGLLGVYLFRGEIFPGAEATKVVTQIVMATQSITQQNTAIIAPSATQVLPSVTPLAQENTVVPSSTAQPTTPPLPTSTVPAIALPFSDNFDNGANSAWQILNGNWLTSNGRYTILDANNIWAFSVLDDPSWSNYRIKVNVKLESSDQGEVAILVRYGGSQYLTFHIVNIFSKAGWALYDGNDFTNISGYGTVALPEQFDLEIDAIGNEFVARINGIETQRISLSGFAQGGVGIGISCFYSPCSSLDNFQVSPAS